MKTVECIKNAFRNTVFGILNTIARVGDFVFTEAGCSTILVIAVTIGVLISVKWCTDWQVDPLRRGSGYYVVINNEGSFYWCKDLNGNDVYFYVRSLLRYDLRDEKLTKLRLKMTKGSILKLTYIVEQIESPMYIINVEDATKSFRRSDDDESYKFKAIGVPCIEQERSITNETDSVPAR